ncbi:MAG: low molecular weight phosphotyrosine protein phosphatase [Saprospiraceae bacterium]|nr:low molecular weight phosphotyrosine protein phosphatase [Saprospiraceae bacterium]
MKILMVCLGNICRSPMAEGVMKNLLTERQVLYPGILTSWEVDSAGIGDWHAGDRPDHRAISTARQHQIDISDQRARQIRLNDFDYFDHILVMDEDNLADALRLAPTVDHELKVRLLMDYKYPGQQVMVPDPYYTNLFDESFKLIHEGCLAFIDELVKPYKG